MRSADRREELGELQEAKQALRLRVWARLECAGMVPIPPGARDRIPNFMGRDQAAERLAARPEWQKARVIKANPDKAQLPVRLRALREGKRVYMAVPRLAGAAPFVLLDPEQLGDRVEEAVTSDGGPRLGRLVSVDEVETIDLALCGTVAVNRNGARLGKGGGFSDIEVALLVEAGKLPRDAPIVTTVHDLQVLDEDIPETDHDFRVELVVTPTMTLDVPGRHARSGIRWEHLDEAKIGAVTVLAGHPGRPGREISG